MKEANLFVQLYENYCTSKPEEAIATAAKLCYSPLSIRELQKAVEDEDREKIKSYISFLMGLGHESPIEHVKVYYGAEGISRVLTHQLVRHRIASYSQQSQRYVKIDELEYIVPPRIKNNKVAIKHFLDHMRDSQKRYSIIADELTAELIKEGMDPRSAEKRAIEDARFILPNAVETKIIISKNVRSWFHFFELRCCNRAQWEIREMAIEMLRQARDYSNVLFCNAGPACYSQGKCSEGKMSCGKAAEMKKIFFKL
ncbi:MAG: FAD-dependent thymidylate synthase [bacterium]